jgi:hypothetical protein
MDSSLCSKCGRVIAGYNHARLGNLGRGKYAYIVHDYYGCDTGCCGHRAYLCNEDDEIIDEQFTFAHPYGISTEEFISSWLKSIWCKIRIDWTKCETSNE